MNWALFKEPAPNMCLAGALVAFLSVTQKMVGSSPFIVMINSFVTEFSETFRQNSNSIPKENPKRNVVKPNGN